MRIIEELKNDQFHSNVEINVNDYLGCCIEDQKAVRKLTMIKPYLLNFLIQNFVEKVKDKRKFLTPCTPSIKFKSQKRNGCT
jgi:hypothetical protein